MVLRLLLMHMEMVVLQIMVELLVELLQVKQEPPILKVAEGEQEVEILMVLQEVMEEFLVEVEVEQTTQVQVLWEETDR
jgi:hypothetical protein